MRRRDVVGAAECRRRSAPRRRPAPRAPRRGRATAMRPVRDRRIAGRKHAACPPARGCRRYRAAAPATWRDALIMRRAACGPTVSSASGACRGVRHVGDIWGADRLLAAADDAGRASVGVPAASSSALPSSACARLGPVGGAGAVIVERREVVARAPRARCARRPIVGWRCADERRLRRLRPLRRSPPCRHRRCARRGSRRRRRA